ncbi:hypothetical protein HanHA300_Chr11g0400651 [Helianthus annuus]|nr:hypothetical protein HanHA300_Chr11g0400651 [Helianthus annuus]KAJ0509223.1 hypothetical protein HanIR_Chr11g0526411 [Helianthus annuus]KAJ0517335.1 hypothetical protein HanHA89_Chr11g0424191 [Helianthus annuus]KAJ0685345.1 hypothetical protein HanLR1_Chr11g0401631 [Helianthus annuus]
MMFQSLTYIPHLRPQTPIGSDYETLHFLIFPVVIIIFIITLFLHTGVNGDSYQLRFFILFFPFAVGDLMAWNITVVTSFHQPLLFPSLVCTVLTWECGGRCPGI